MVGAWLHEAEGALRQEVIVQQAHDITASTVHRALEQHKVSVETLKEEAQLKPQNCFLHLVNEEFCIGNSTSPGQIILSCFKMLLSKIFFIGQSFKVFAFLY